MKRFSFVLALALLAVLAVSAIADDLMPPPWRGQPGTTFGKWEFATDNPNPLPEPGFVYPWGMPTTQINPGFMQFWQPVWNGRQGVWPLSGEIIVTIPNQPIANPFKDIWIQLTWDLQVPNVSPAVSETRFGVPASLVREIPLGGGWYHSTYHIRLQPNPDWEQILITGAIDVDELVIDTICAVPEPSSILALSGSLLAMAGLALRRRR